MSEEGVTHETPDNDPKFRIARAALETGRVAALNEGIEEETEVMVIVAVGDEKAGSLSLMEPAEHLQMLIRATQSFADATNQSIQVIQVAGGGQG